MHSLGSAAVQYTNYGAGGAFELPTQSGTQLLMVKSSYIIPVCAQNMKCLLHVLVTCF